MLVVPCVCVLVVLAITFHQVDSARVRQAIQVNSIGSEEEPPPLGGCTDNMYYTTCCCFVDYGVLKQERCGCTSGPNSCAGKALIEYGQVPSRPIRDELGPKLWHTPEGYVRGYRAVDAEFCKAAPVNGPQIDSYERSYECACSNSMSQIYEMSCGSGCSVSNCRRWQSLAIDWTPFVEGRGRCCVSTYHTTSEGCEQEIEPITEDRARVILQDALQNAMINGTKAFVPRTSETLMSEMTKSFKGAMKKKMSTSRSGAQFFFSENQKYILKSIHRPEYLVLSRITRPHNVKGTSLVDHIQYNKKMSDQLSLVSSCVTFHIAKMPRKIAGAREYSRLQALPVGNSSHARSDPAAKLAARNIFYGDWFFDSSKGTASFTRKVMNIEFRAYWCGEASQFRIVEEDSFNDNAIDCTNLEIDAFYQWLLRSKDESGASMEDVMELYDDFTMSFEQGLYTGIKTTLDYVHVTCKQKRYPETLINTFAMAFEYRASTWMVIQNSNYLVKEALKSANFNSFWKKEHEMFDVKPFPIHSDERESLFKLHFIKGGMDHWRNWNSVLQNLKADINLMDGLLDYPMVDYSLLVSVFYINDARMVLDEVDLAQCVESKLKDISTIVPTLSDYGRAQGSILVCFSIIDILMEFVPSKRLENTILRNKWSSWSNKFLSMFSCLGNMKGRYCSSYRALQSKFHGVDAPLVRYNGQKSAVLQDVSWVFNADGEVNIRSPKGQGQPSDDEASHIKCCCNSHTGRCRLADATKKSASWLSGNPRGCGKLVGKGWHSFWREAGSCRVSLREALALEERAMVGRSYAM